MPNSLSSPSVPIVQLMLFLVREEEATGRHPREKKIALMQVDLTKALYLAIDRVGHTGEQIEIRDEDSAAQILQKVLKRYH